MKTQKQLNFLQRAQYAGLVALGKFLAFLGFSAMKYFAKFLGLLMWLILKRRRNVAISNIKRTLHVNKEEAKKIAYKSFQHSALSFLEIVLVKSFSLNPLRTQVKIAEPELFEKLDKIDSSFIITTAHMGAWEFMAAIMGDIFRSSRECFVVTRQYPNPVVQKFIARNRESHGVTMLGHKMVAPAVLKALKKNGGVGFLVDHRALAHEAITLDFLGRQTAVNMGPALLALRGNALIIPSFIVRDKEGYVLHIQDFLDTRELTGTREENVKTIATFYTKAVEKIIRQYPEQWFWMHNRWKD